MKSTEMRLTVSVMFFVFLLAGLLGCFPSKRVTSLPLEEASVESNFNNPTKVFLHDASILLLPKGFGVRNDTLRGTGERIWLDSTIVESEHVIPMDSIAAVSYYEQQSSNLGSFMLVLYGASMPPYAIHCLNCPKCCFGSCPTVYTQSNSVYKLEAELFSYSLSRYFQEQDLDRLSLKPSSNDDFQLRLTNEALETHFINQLNLLAVEHPPNTQVYPTPNGNFITAQQLYTPTEATDYYDQEVLDLLLYRDGQSYRTDLRLVEQMGVASDRDRIDLKLTIPDKATRINLILRLKNTLLSTILFYDVVLGSQGLEALEWTERLNTDSLYASYYHSIYQALSGLKIKLRKNDTWVEKLSIGDVGPIVWKDLAVELPVEQNGQGEMTIRLEFFPDNLMIDYIAFEPATDDGISVIKKEILPETIRDYKGDSANTLIKNILYSDDQFLVTNPGDSYYINYQVPTHPNKETTLFVYSKGYYKEWIRGEWVHNRKSGYRFNLFDVEGTIRQLRKSWLENRELMESTFFKTRIPLAEEL